MIAANIKIKALRPIMDNAVAVQRYWMIVSNGVRVELAMLMKKVYLIKSQSHATLDELDAYPANLCNIH